jgi:hypothetical protein
MSRGRKAGKAELLVKGWLEMNGWLVHRAAQTGYFTYETAGGDEGRACKSHDLFGCIDLLAIKPADAPRSCQEPSVETWAIQVTTQAGRSARRRKIEKVKHWPISWKVSILSHETIPDPANRSHKLHYLKKETWQHGVVTGWSDSTAFAIKAKEIDAYRREQRREALGLKLPVVEPPPAVEQEG